MYIGSVEVVAVAENNTGKTPTEIRIGKKLRKYRFSTNNNRFSGRIPEENGKLHRGNSGSNATKTTAFRRRRSPQVVSMTNNLLKIDEVNIDGEAGQEHYASTVRQ